MSATMHTESQRLILGLTRPNFLRVVIYPVSAIIVAVLIYFGFVYEAKPSDGQAIRAIESSMGMNPGKSIEAARKLVERQPEHARSWVALGRALESRWRKRALWRKRLAQQQTVLAEKNLPANLRHNYQRNVDNIEKTLAALEKHDEAADRKEALAAYARALELGQDPGVMLLVVQAHAWGGRLAEALALAEKVRAIKQLEPATLIELELTVARVLALAAHRDPARAATRREQAIAALDKARAACEKQSAAATDADARAPYDQYHAQVLHLLGNLCREKGDLDRAEGLLRRALELQKSKKDSPKKPLYAHDLARLLSARGKHVDALAYYEIAARQQNASAWYDQACALLRLWYKTAALDRLGMAVLVDPRHVRARLRQDRQLWQRLTGDPHYERIVGFDPQLGPYAGRSLLLMAIRALEPGTSMEELEELERDLAKIATDYPNRPLPHLLRGQFLLRVARDLGRLDRRRAAEEARKKSASKAQQVQIVARLEALAQDRARVAKLLPKPDASAEALARESFAQALKLQGDRKMLAAIGETYMVMDRWAEGLAYIRQALAKAEDRWTRVNLLAHAAFAQQQLRAPEKALVLYREALGLDPANGALYSAVAELELQLERPVQAEAAFRKALGVIPTPIYYLGLGRALIAQRRYADAEKAVARYAKHRPEAFRTLYYQAQIKQLRGQEREALEMFKALYDRDPAELARRVSLHPVFWSPLKAKSGYAELLADAAAHAGSGADKK